MRALLPKTLRAPYTLSMVLATLMAAQAGLGLLFQNGYRDVAWIRATWFGNDWVTLVVAVPALLLGVSLARRGSVRGTLLWLGMLGYAAYNYAFYLFGAAMNAFFPLYVAPLLLAAITLVVMLSHLDVAAVAAAFRPNTPVRTVGGYLVFVATGLGIVWLLQWALYVFAGRATPVEPEAFKLVMSLDMSIMVPALAIGGILLWRRSAWGFVGAAIAGLQATFYLLVLTVNSAIAVVLGLTASPGEIPIWGTLGVLTAASMVLLLANVREAGEGTAEAAF
jgi:hypothetical protein